MLDTNYIDNHMPPAANAEAVETKYLFYEPTQEWSCGELKLVAAVLQDAVTILQKYHVSPRPRERGAYYRAVDWVRSESRGVFTFADTCDALAIDPDAARSALLSKYGPKPSGYQKGHAASVDPHVRHKHFFAKCQKCVAIKNERTLAAEVRKAAYNIFCRCGCRQRGKYRGCCKAVYSAAQQRAHGRPSDQHLMAALDRQIEIRRLMKWGRRKAARYMPAAKELSL